MAGTARTANVNSGGPDGSGERQLTFGSGESFGRFAPNGQFVSYTGMPAKDDPYARITIATWDDATGTIGVGRTLQAVSGDADGAVWSPDSRHFLFTTEVYPECSVKGGNPNPTHDGEAVVNGAPNVDVGGTDNVAAWRSAQPAGWAEEDACDKAKDEAADKDPVKAQVWEGLLYRHWDHWTGAKRTHVLLAEFTELLIQISEGVGNAGWRIRRDVTPANEVGDAETPTWMLGGPQEYAWAPDSKEIAYVTDLSAVPAASTNNDVFTLRIDEAGAKPVKVSTSAGSDDEPEYSPDGKWLAFRSQRQAGFESDRERLMVYDREKKTARELMPKFDNWVDEFAWSPLPATTLAAALRAGKGVGPQIAQHLYVISGNNGEEALYRVSLVEADIQRLTDAGEFSGIAVAPDGLRAIAAGMTVDRPSELFAVDELNLLCMSSDGGGWPAGTRAQANQCSSDEIREKGQFTHLNDALLSQLDLNPLEPCWFAGAEGTKIEGFIVKPPGFDASKKYPVKFIMHGGPQTMAGDSWSYRWNWELMAASGYVVVGINRRGSTGYGQKFVDEVSGDWGGRAYEDLMKGLDYAEAHYAFIDKTRECALGASYGGYMADWVLTHTNRFKCIVTHDGLYDPESAYGTTEEMWFPEWEFRRPEDYPKGWDGFTGGYYPVGKPAKTTTGVLRSAQDDGEKQATAKTDAGHAAEPWRYAGLPASEDPFRRWSPMQFIQNAKTPTLVIHSQRDYRLDVSQDFALYTALQRLGVPSRFLYFPDEGHWVLKPRNAELWNAVVEEWCDRWTKSGRYAQTGR